MNLSDSKGYVFAVTIDDAEGMVLGAGEVAVATMLASTRTAFFVPPHAVHRYEVMAFIIHIEAILDGLVELVSPESEDGWVEFPSLYVSIRGIHAPDGYVAFEVSGHDCGCDDAREFNHGGFITIVIDPETLQRELVALDEALQEARVPH